MAQRTEFIEGLGTVVLAKRRGTKHIRLSITAKGDIRISVPYWAPYEAGIHFAKSRQEWIEKQMAPRQTGLLRSGQRIGKAHSISFVNGQSLRSAVSDTIIKITMPEGATLSDDAVQALAKTAAERALKKQAEHLLPQRLDQLADKNGFSYRSVSIKKLHSRWGSCSSNKEIALSYYLMQLPWQLVDYVLLHELSHTEHMHHQTSFWDLMETVLPNVKQLRKELKQYRPMVIPA